MCVCVGFFFLDKRIARVFFGWESYLLNHPFVLWYYSGQNSQSA
jgi:hypothetical protein